MPKVIFVHLLNDYSGSPLVLSNVVRGHLAANYSCEIITSKGTEGFLSKIDGVGYSNIQYRWHPNPYLRLILYLWSQLMIFVKLLRYRQQDITIYCNTLLPFGAALAGRVMGKRVVYHIHEHSLRPLLLKRWLRWVANSCASEVIFVSDFLAKEESLPRVPSRTVHNALADTFQAQAEHYRQSHPATFRKQFIALMLCSLKDYKGVREFVSIAKALPNLSFELVINAIQEDIDTYFKDEILPNNLTIFPRQNNVHPFFQRASLVLNLSHPEQWVETFGMTLLEGMCYGLPCIAPPVGGPVEIVQNNVNGYLIDVRELAALIQTIEKVANDPNLYRQLSRGAVETTARFSYQKMIAAVLNQPSSVVTLESA